MEDLISGTFHAEKGMLKSEVFKPNHYFSGCQDIQNTVRTKSNCADFQNNFRQGTRVLKETVDLEDQKVEKLERSMK